MPDYRPCLVLALNDDVERDAVAARYRRAGWDVYLAGGGAELRRLARLLEADLVLLSLTLDAESGWLTCAKLLREVPAARVMLCGDDTPRNRRLASFVGAAGLVSAEAARPPAQLAAA